MVFEAEDLELSRRVAIKLIKPALLASLTPGERRSVVQRFVQEARAAAVLTHPGAAIVHRAGIERGTPFIVMEWLEGRTLESILLDGPLTLTAVVRLGLEVLSVLEAAHARGVIHRDIKPANLIVGATGAVKLTDFGIARVRGHDAVHTQIGLVLGTPQYAAPEQLVGGATDARADLYSCGAVLYEALVGRLPIDAPTHDELVRRVLGRMPLAPSVLVPGLPPAVDDVLLRALAKRPEERFRSAADMAAALGSVVDVGAPQSPPRPARPRETARTLPGDVPSAVVDGYTPHAVVASLVRQWPGTALGSSQTDQLLDRLAERPLHAAAFSGALDLGSVILLYCEGVLEAAFDDEGARGDDDLLASLPEVVEGVLRPIPPGLSTRVPCLLGTLVHPMVPRLAGLGAVFTDLPALAARLADEGFDGVLAFSRSGSFGAALFDRGTNALDVFGAGWPEANAEKAWSRWVAQTDAVAAVVERSARPPSRTFGQQLRGQLLRVARRDTSADSAVLEDASARRVSLEPAAGDGSRRPLGGETLRVMLAGDPATAAARWCLDELELELERHGRARRWRGLIDALRRTEQLRLYERLESLADSRVAVTGLEQSGAPSFVIDWIHVGDERAVARFVDLALQAKARDDRLGAAILIARRFTDEGLRAYMSESGRARSVFAMLDAFTHLEGYVRFGVRSGLHILLVDASEGRYRPLMPA